MRTRVRLACTGDPTHPTFEADAYREYGSYDITNAGEGSCPGCGAEGDVLEEIDVTELGPTDPLDGLPEGRDPNEGHWIVRARVLKAQALQDLLEDRARNDVTTALARARVLDAEGWVRLAEHAEVNIPSRRTVAMVIGTLERAATYADDPFAGLC